MKTKNLLFIGIFIIALAFLALLIIFPQKSESQLIEKCYLLPGLEGCENYRDKYQETGLPYERNIQGLQPVKSSSIVLLNNGSTTTLNPKVVYKEINGQRIRMFGYNGEIPGSLLKVKQGDTIYVNVTNELDQETTIHWHGIRLNNKFDGVPHSTQEPIMPGETFTYEIKFPDAGIYWYHPHVREDYQQELGLYGNILVSPTDETYFNKVNREEFLFVDDINLQDEDVFTYYSNKINHVLMGRFGNTFLINGNTNYTLNVIKGEVIRFFVTNPSNTRTFNISIPEAQIKLIGSDGGSYEKEEFINSVIVSPSERVTIEVLFTNPGKYSLTHITPLSNYTLGEITVTNAPISKDYSGDFLSLKNNSFVNLEVNGLREYSNKEPDVQINLGVKVPSVGHIEHPSEGNEDNIEWEDTMQLTNIRSSNETIKWTIIDEATGRSNMDINYNWKVGDKVKIRIFNDPNSDHPMQHPIHFHGQRFVVLSKDGIPNDNLAWKDTVLVPKGSTIDILMDITNPGKWMTHCHIAEHLSSGMMFEFGVEE